MHLLQHYDDAHLHRLNDMETEDFIKAAEDQSDMTDFVKQQQIKQVQDVSQVDRRILASRVQSTGDGHMNKLFQEVELQKTILPVDDWNIYEQLMKAAEAFSRTILSRRSRLVVDLINRTTGRKLKPEDFTGRVEIGYHKHGTHIWVFRVNFELKQKSKARCGQNDFLAIAIVTKMEKSAQDITWQQVKDIKELSGSPYTPRFGTCFVYQGKQYYVEEFIEGPTARELNQTKKLIPKRRGSIQS